MRTSRNGLNVVGKRESFPKLVAERKAVTGGLEEPNEAEEMDLPEFATRYRQRVQGVLWQRKDKITVGDLVKLAELERETQKYAEKKRPRELRVVWINKKNTT